jgi:hypothetical protein
MALDLTNTSSESGVQPIRVRASEVLHEPLLWPKEAVEREVGSWVRLICSVPNVTRSRECWQSRPARERQKLPTESIRRTTTAYSSAFR